MYHGRHRYELSWFHQFLWQWIERACCPIGLVLSSLISNNAILNRQNNQLSLSRAGLQEYGTVMTFNWLDLKLVLFQYIQERWKRR